MLTESEAKEKWCPLSRVLLPVHQSGNRISTFHKKHGTGSDIEFYAQQEADCKCIASACMFWRRGGTRLSPEGVNYLGYCGAAGKSE